MESYKVPAKYGEATLVEKKSEFIAVAAPVESEDAALGLLDSVRGKHRTANHNVYAYTLRENARQRYSDDGEPAKTAGLPVLDAIRFAGVENCIVVVTRYFGGTLLGTGGLVRAYSGAARAALQQAGTSTIRLCVPLAIEVPYPLYEQAHKLMLEAGAQLEEPQFGAAVKLNGILPDKKQAALEKALQELCRGKSGLVIGAAFYTPFEETNHEQ